MAKGIGSPCISIRLGAAVTALLLATSCGGGGMGGGGGPPPPPANQPPAITSPAAANAAENSSSTIYTATATDPDGNPLTFSLSGGTDRARFSITGAGALSFAQPPDFENPADADGNNVYQVQLAVSDGMTSATLDLAVTVTNVGPDNFRVTRVANGFIEPIMVTPAPGTSSGSSAPPAPLRIFVAERGGRIYILNLQTGARSLFLDLSTVVSTAGEGGLLGFAPAPDFANTGAFFVYLTNASGNIELRHYQTLAGNRDVGSFSTGDVILTIPHPTFNNHFGGWIGFGPDNMLYAAVGDGGGGGDPGNNAQNTNALLGKLLRLNATVNAAGVIVDDFPADPLRDYGIPAGNPFAAGGGRPEIWAYGLRNPFRASFDSATQNLWIGDVGENMREEIDLMRPTDGGANFGWRIMEGTAVFNGTPNASLVPPVAEYLHGPGPREGVVVTGGAVYRGPVEALQGEYFFADFGNPNIWSIRASQASIGTTIPSSQFRLRNADLIPPVGTLDDIICFGFDKDNNLYLVDFDGEIYRIEPA